LCAALPDLLAAACAERLDRVAATRGNHAVDDVGVQQVLQPLADDLDGTWIDAMMPLRKSPLGRRRFACPNGGGQSEDAL
jgi:hypothetical protein